MRINRGLVFWGVALITAGGVALAIQSGVISNEQARLWWRLWPVALIVIGLAIVAARSPFALGGTLAAGLVVGGLAGSLISGWPAALSAGCGGEPDGRLAEDGSFGSEAEVRLEFSCGDLAVDMEDGSDWAVDAGYTGDSRPELQSGDRLLSVKAEGGGFWFGDRRQEWQVSLPTDVDLALEVEANAASSELTLAGGRFSSLGVDANAGTATLDLSGTSADEFSLEMNAGSVTMIADGSTTLDGSIEMNAGSLDVCIPDGVVFAITVEDANITFSHNLDDAGLERSGDTWRSGDGPEAIALSVDGNAASFTLNPEEGCS